MVCDDSRANRYEAKVSAKVNNRITHSVAENQFQKYDVIIMKRKLAPTLDVR